MPKGTEATLFTEQTADSYVWGQQDGKFGRFPALYFRGETGLPGATGTLLDATVFTGTDYPAANLGMPGDVYLKYDNALDALICRGLRMIRVEEISTADDLVMTGLAGGADGQYWFLLSGYLDVGASNRTIVLQPNGDTTVGHYHAAAETATDVSSAAATTTTTYVSGTAGIIMAQSKYGVDNYVSIWGSLSAKASVYRMAEFDSLCIRTDATEGLCRARYCGAWKNTVDDITSLTLSFGGATAFSGVFNLYTNR